LAGECAEGNLTIGRSPKGQMRFLAEVEQVIVPMIHLDDAPAAGKGLGEGRNLGHHPVSASGFVRSYARQGIEIGRVSFNVSI
jgi:hypothetical protein